MAQNETTGKERTWVCREKDGRWECLEKTGKGKEFSGKFWMVASSAIAAKGEWRITGENENADRDAEKEAREKQKKKRRSGNEEIATA